MSEEQEAVGTEEATPEQTKKERATKPEFGLVGSDDLEVYPFKVEIPEGYEFGKFASLKKRDFTEDYLFMLHRAAEYELKVVDLRAKAEEYKKLGNAKDRAKAKKLLKLREQFASLKETLAGQGIDVDSLLASASE